MSTLEHAISNAATHNGRRYLDADDHAAIADAVREWLRGQEQAPTDARDALARAWDEGEQAGQDNADDGYPDPVVENPYRAASKGGDS